MEILLFGENLKMLRELDGLKIAEMQSDTGFPRSTWAGYENGSSFPSFKDLIKISDYFGILESDLLRTKLTENDLWEMYASYVISQEQPFEIGNTPRSKYFIRYFNANKTAIALRLKGQNASQNASPAQALPTKNTKKTAGKPYDLQPERPTIVSESGISYNLGAPKVITVNERQEENIIYVPVKARAGYLTGYGDPEFISTLPTYRLPGLDNATYRMFETDGPSMAPTITSGDRVIGQWVDSLDNIRENRVHVIVTRNDGIVIKRVQNRIDQRGKIVLKSDTITHRSEYPTYQIDPEDVKEIWYCRLKLSGDFSEPAEIYHRVNDLEADMVEVRQILSQIYPSKPL
jgi:transcriptional regulator with XRE-family HTH domain